MKIDKWWNSLIVCRLENSFQDDIHSSRPYSEFIQCLVSRAENTQIEQIERKKEEGKTKLKERKKNLIYTEFEWFDGVQEFLKWKLSQWYWPNEIID